MRKKQFNGITNYFMYLLVSYVRNLSDFGVFPRHTTSKWKKQYQKSGRQLNKLSFVPDPCIWEAYRQVAEQYGVSICHLFVIVMRLDWYEWLMAECPEEIPTMPVKHEFRNSLIKWPKKLTNFNYNAFSYQKIDFNKETLQRQGSFRKLLA